MHWGSGPGSTTVYESVSRSQLLNSHKRSDPFWRGGKDQVQFEQDGMTEQNEHSRGTSREGESFGLLVTKKRKVLVCAQRHKQLPLGPLFLSAHRPV